jgi:two-component system, OmpR family, sensor histidine kinase VicK
MNFGVSDNEMAATIDKKEGGKRVKSLLISSEPLYVRHFASIFEELWVNGIDADDIIKEIEEGVDFADIEVIPNPRAKTNENKRTLNEYTLDFLLTKDRLTSS